ncbi:MAG: ATP-binding cassette domain-containing protein [Propionibacteriaceae bacterium]|nr:ATP-binding cassette domain-containing protein [Propionibacteriaceae bacterium]
MISIEKLTKRYGSSTVVDDVTLDLPTGGVTAIIGPNGAGKSTMLSIIARLLDADSGGVTVGSLNVAECDTKELAKVLSVLKQDNHLSVRLTVADLVAFGRYPHSGGRLSDLDRQIVDAAIAYLDLDDLRHRFLDEMSGGQRQRAFVAMVLAQDTDYVLLDEPLNNLDMSHARAMMRRLRRAADELGKTIVVVIHDINFASVWSDHIVAMKNGRVAAVGPPDVIITEDVLQQVYDMDLTVHEVAGQRFALYYT